MALTTLQIMNRILNKLALIDTDLTVLTALNTEQNRVFIVLEEAYTEISNYTAWTPLRTQQSDTLVNGTNAYALPSDFRAEDPNSFIYDNTRRLRKATPQEVDKLRRDRTLTGEPFRYYREGTNIKFDYIPDANADSKNVVYYYFKTPTALSTASPSATTWLPANYDDTVLVNMVVSRYFVKRERGQQGIYYEGLVFGSSRHTGALADLVRDYEDPIAHINEAELDFHSLTYNRNNTNVNENDYAMELND